MKSFFLRVLFNVAASLVSFGILFLIMIGILVMIGGGERMSVRDNSLLVLDLGVSINDSPGGSGLNEVMEQMLGGERATRVSLREMVQTLHAAAEDSRIRGLVITGSLVADNYGSGYAALREVRAAMAKFQASGKRVYAYMQAPALKDYFLISGADEIHISPSGFLPWNGLAAEGVFLSEFLERNGVRVHVFEAGDFKGAADMFKRQDFSPNNRSQLQRIIDNRWQYILDTVAVSRNVQSETLRKLGDQAGILDPAEALQAGLVDAVSHYDQFLQALNQDIPGFEQVVYGDYASTIDTSKVKRSGLGGGDRSRIAVVYMEGDIMVGESVYPVVGGDVYSREIRKLREDPLVKAVVIRVNSPGGAAFAGEQIAREVELTSKEKPVVVSLGSIAASAGYMIAAPANVIIAEPATLTGSIGAYLLFPDFEQLGADYGIYSDSVVTGPLANLTSVMKAPSAREQVIFERFLNDVYQQFLQVVEKGRKLPREELAKVADGKIWTGQEAVEIGLADRLGGLQDAIALAQELAGMNGEGLEVTEFPAELTGRELFEEIFGDKKTEPLAAAFETQRLGIQPLTWNFLPVSMRQAARAFYLTTVDHHHGKVYARLPFWLE